jgi:hypothetical protein
LRIELATEVSGKVAAIFIASSISIIILGILTYTRKQLPWLEIYSPAGTFSGIWFYSYIIWAVLWVVLYFLLRNKQSAGSIRLWLLLFLASLTASSVLIEMSLNWSLLFE